MALFYWISYVRPILLGKHKTGLIYEEAMWLYEKSCHMWNLTLCLLKFLYFGSPRDTSIVLLYNFISMNFCWIFSLLFKTHILVELTSKLNVATSVPIHLGAIEDVSWRLSTFSNLIECYKTREKGYTFFPRLKFFESSHFLSPWIRKIKENQYF